LVEISFDNMQLFGGKTYPTLPSVGDGIYSEDERASKTPSDLLCEFSAMVAGKQGETIFVAATDPSSPALHAFVHKHVGTDIAWYQTSASDIARVMRKANLDHKQEIEQILSTGLIDETSVSRVVTYILQYAFKESASDVHFEPRKRDVRVRFRIDGVLREMFVIPSEKYGAVVARIKILAHLRTDESRNPQDGRIEPDGYDNASLRVSIMPTMHGEKVVMRILDESNAILDLAGLGFNEDQMNIVKRNIEKPYGMIVASGPTGSGKTTTLYALLQQLDQVAMNIATLEDPIEYALPGVNQTQVHPDRAFTFAKGLRTLLRQDPDVVLVGELRDQETANMAAQASMTGHLVLTSMHTNDAPSAFPRFVEMGVEEFMVVTTVNLIIAQRLVRRLCKKCKTTGTLSDVVRGKITERADMLASLKELSPSSVEHLGTEKFPQAKGCAACMHSGYAGRIGIFELLEMTPEIHDAVLSGASADKVRAIAQKSGFETMLTNGLRKVLAQETTFEEVIRTTRTN